MNSIQQAVASEYGIPVDKLKLRTRKRKYSEPRMVNISLCIVIHKTKQKKLSEEFDITQQRVSKAHKTVKEQTRLNKSFRLKMVSILKQISDSQQFRERIISRLISDFCY